MQNFCHTLWQNIILNFTTWNLLLLKFCVSVTLWQPRKRPSLKTSRIFYHICNRNFARTRQLKIFWNMLFKLLVKDFSYGNFKLMNKSKKKQKNKRDFVTISLATSLAKGRQCITSLMLLIHNSLILPIKLSCHKQNFVVYHKRRKKNIVKRSLFQLIKKWLNHLNYVSTAIYLYIYFLLWSNYFFL